MGELASPKSENQKDDQDRKPTLYSVQSPKQERALQADKAVQGSWFVEPSTDPPPVSKKRHGKEICFRGPAADRKEDGEEQDDVEDGRSGAKGLWAPYKFSHAHKKLDANEDKGLQEENAE